MEEAARGRLLLVPNTLDLGTWSADSTPPDLRAVLPDGVLQVAARLQDWVVENAKSARLLLKRVGAVTPLARPLQDLSIRELPRPPKGRSGSAGPPDREFDALIQPCLEGRDLGLMSEAGLPAVADPGAGLVRAAHRAGVRVVPLVGPSALILGIAASGLNGQSFAFVGYLPADAGLRLQRLRELESQARRWRQTQLMIETPYRNAGLASALIGGLSPATWLSISQGLTLDGGWTRSAPVARWRQAGEGWTRSLSDRVPAVFAFLPEAG